jgi:predicted metal-dependent hydrolase
VDYLVEHPEVGTIKYIGNNRAKRIIISVKPEFVRVVIPKRQSFKSAQKFVESRLEWIKKNKAKIKLQAQKKDELPEIDRKVARKVLCRRIGELAQLHNFVYNRISIRKQKTRWGSCSSKDNINLNMNLLHLPPELMDYVLLHELVHTKVKNHSKDFWDELDTVVPNARIIDRKLKDYQYCLI